MEPWTDELNARIAAALKNGQRPEPADAEPIDYVCVIVLVVFFLTAAIWI